MIANLSAMQVFAYGGAALWLFGAIPAAVVTLLKASRCCFARASSRSVSFGFPAEPPGPYLRLTYAAAAPAELEVATQKLAGLTPGGGRPAAG